MNEHQEYNALDQRSLDEVEQRNQDARIRAEEDARASWRWWNDILSTKVGRREIWGWIESAGTFRRGNENYAVAPAGVPADRSTDYHMGSRDFGLSRWDWLQVYHTEHAIMMRAENDPTYADVRRKIEDMEKANRLGQI